MIWSILILLFIGLPLAELALLLRIGDIVGPWTTLGIVVLTGLLGATLARLEGLRVAIRIQEDLHEGRMPAPYILDGVMILIAGAVLITPVFITDTAGFLLLIPPFRLFIKQWVKRMIEKRIRKDAIDVTYVEW